MKEQLYIYKGTQFSSGSFQAQDPRKEDLFPSIPFYTIDVEGVYTKRQLKVKRNKPGGSGKSSIK